MKQHRTVSQLRILGAVMRNLALEAPGLPEKLRVTCRYTAWQVGKRRSAVSRVVATPFGTEFVVPTWSEIGGVVYATGMYERHNQGVLAKLMRPGECFVDVGANIGIYSSMAAAQGMLVLAYEPGDRAAHQLQVNLTLTSPAGGWSVVRAALADKTGTARFQSTGDVGNQLSDDGDLEVDILRLDDDYLRHHLPRVAIMKVDAEGHDLEVLKGAEQTLSVHRPILQVEVWAGEKVSALLTSLGYDCYRVRDESTVEQVFGALTEQCNALYLPSPDRS